MKLKSFILYGSFFTALISAPLVAKAYFDLSEISKETYLDLVYNLEFFDTVAFDKTKSALSDGIIIGKEFSEIYSTAIENGCPYEVAISPERIDLAKSDLQKLLAI